MLSGVARQGQSVWWTQESLFLHKDVAIPRNNFPSMGLLPWSEPEQSFLGKRRVPESPVIVVIVTLYRVAVSWYPLPVTFALTGSFTVAGLPVAICAATPGCLLMILGFYRCSINPCHFVFISFWGSGRGLITWTEMDGAIIWILSFVRFRVNTFVTRGWFF